MRETAARSVSGLSGSLNSFSRWPMARNGMTASASGQSESSAICLILLTSYLSWISNRCLRPMTYTRRA